jgi:hypothetical protein
MRKDPFRPSDRTHHSNPLRRRAAGNSCEHSPKKDTNQISCIPSLPPPLYFPRVGELSVDLPPREEDIVGAPLRNLPPLVTTKKIRFGTVGMGMDLPRLIWSEESQIFSSQDVNMVTALQGRPQKQEVRKWDQLPKSFLSRNAVDVLIIDSSTLEATRSSTLPMLEATPRAQRPKAIVIAGPSKWVLNLPTHS